MASPKLLPVVALFSACALSIVATVRAADEKPRYLNATQPLEARVDDLLARLTLEEKIALIHGDSKFTTAAIPRLGIPQRWLSDGPHGVREEIAADEWKPAGRTDDFSTYLPVCIALGATWNPELGRLFGQVIGEEALARGKHMMLGPGVNIMRTPFCGRNFEYMGEDPFLAGRMAIGSISAMQALGVSACVKHYALNNQEWQRGTINVEVDERALREIYLPAFRAAAQEAHVMAVMGAYNKFRGAFCCQNDYLLNTVLKGEWGFQGVVVSDWNAVHDTATAVSGGLDLEMGTNKPYDDYYLAAPYLEGLKKGEYSTALLDDKVRRNLRQMITSGLLDTRPAGSLNTPAHQAAARRIAEEAIVLLKNSGNALPLDRTKLKTIAVIGENAIRLHAHGGQSSEIKAFYEIPPLEGITRLVDGRANITFSMGYRKDGDAALADRAVEAAKVADAVIFVGGLNHDRFFDTESSDRKDLKLPYGQDALISRIVAANPRTIVVFIAGSPVEMGDWLDKVPAVVQAWYPGMEGGNALARVLFGEVNPSGKLPCTFPRRLEDSPAHALGAYPGKDGTVHYDEGILVGYRWFDTKNIEPLFAFGHGLSYASFDYSALRVVEIAGANTGDAGSALVNVEFDLTNTGTREGAEVAQLYVHDVQSSLPRPRKELKAFKKIVLAPGAKQTVSLALDRSAFAFYDPEKNGWVAEAGDFSILVGSSSRDIRLEGKFRLATTTVGK